MSDAETIKEFLVGLGFKIDESSFKKFDGALGKATREAFAVGAAAVAAGVAIEAFVTKVAGAGDRLYFASKRIGSNAGEVQSFGFALSQMGGSVDDAKASMESMAEFVKSQPGAGGLLTRMFGVNASSLGNTVKTLQEMEPALRKVDYWQAKIMVAPFGISDNFLKALRDGTFDKFADEHSRRLKNYGVDEQEFANKSNDFMTKVRSLSDSFGVLGESMGANLMPSATGFLNFIQSAVDGTAKLNKETNGLATVFSETLVAAIATANLAFMRTPLGLLIAGTVVGSQLYEKLPKGAQEAIAFPMKIYQKTVVGAARLVGYLPPEGDKPAAPDGTKANQVMAFFQGQGWNKAQSAGITANLGRESAFDPAAKGDNGKALGVAQWHPDRQAQFAAWAGHDIQSSNLEEQLRFIQYDITQGAFKGIGDRLKYAGNDSFLAGQIFSRGYEKPLDMFGNVAALRGGDAEKLAAQGSAAPTINQTTTISVTSSGNPQETASAVGYQQKDVNQQLVRNVAGAVQ